MASRTIDLTRDEEAFIESVVRSGDYRDANEAIRAALEALRESRAEDARKSDALRAALLAGAADLERGAYTEVEDADLDDFLDSLTPPATAPGASR